MKKIVLMCGAVILGFTAFSQSSVVRPSGTDKPVLRERKLIVADENAPVSSKSKPATIAARHGNTSGNSTQSVLTLGTAANALTAMGIRTTVWADPTMNTVMFTRRAMGGTTGVINGGRIFYDISTNNGLAFDTAKGPVYTPSLSTVINPSNARFPQGAIYNPAGTTNPNDAYMTYYAATLNGTNTAWSQTPPLDWGGNVFGAYKLDYTTGPTQNEISSDSATGVFFYVPEMLHMCKNGNTFALSESDYGNSDIVSGRGTVLDYTGTMIFEKGVFNTTTHDYDYTQQLVSVPAGILPYNRWYSHPYVGGSTNTDPVSTMLGSSICFSDNGQIGYMVNNMWSDTVESADTSAIYHIYKTTDGGATWNRTDSTPTFDEINHLCLDSNGWTMGTYGQYFDVAMDANNNLHIVTIVGTKYMDDQFGTFAYPYENDGGLFDIFTTDGGTTWYAHKLGKVTPVLGVMGDPANPAERQTYDQRSQITRSWDGTKLFFSWFVTDTVTWPLVVGNASYYNSNPDMHVVGYDVTTGQWTPEMNATAFPALNGDADGACLLASVAYYALDNGSGGYKIPTVIGTPSLTSTNNNPDWRAPFTFKYLDGIEVTSGSYTVQNVFPGSPNPNHVLLQPVRPTATTNMKLNTDFVVLPVRPNPIQGSAELMVQISKPGTVTVEVRNVLGQVVSVDTHSNQSSGLHKFTIDASQLEKGVYLYTVTYNGQQITHKMNVQ